MAIIHQRELQTGTVVINTDNQSSIQALGDTGRKSGQIYVIQAVQLINVLRGIGITVRLHWIPAHIGVTGKAKEATGWRERVIHGKKTETDTYDVAQRSAIEVRMISTGHPSPRQSRNGRKNGQESRGSSLRKMQPVPTRRVQLIRKGVKRAKSSLITRMKTGK